MRTSGCLLLLAVVFLFPGSASALEEPTDSLAGKVVHVYLPSPSFDSLWVQNWNIPMKRDGGYWHTATLRGDRYSSNQGFYVTTSLHNKYLTKAGFLSQEVAGMRFQLEDFQGRREMWIVMDPSYSLSTPPVILLEPPKVIHVLNPWPVTGPRLAFPGGGKGMVASAEHCGWFTAFLLKPGELALHLQEIHGTDTYGSGGLGSGSDFDLAALFAALGVPGELEANLWLDTETKTWLPAHPGKTGTCRFQMAATVRDFGSAHPDFDFGSVTSSGASLGMVANTLSPDRKPVRTAKTAIPEQFHDFESWWRTDTANSDPGLRSYETCVDIPMSKSDDGLWEYNSDAAPSRGFYPIDGFANPNNVMSMPTCFTDPVTGLMQTGLPRHNLNFCLESHASFVYQRGQRIEFRGDDDAWIFIDGKLVLDLGGIHTPLVDTVFLDELNLVPGNTYPFDFFFCERQPCASHLRIKTPIYFRQPAALEAVPDSSTPGGFRMIKRTGGVGSCLGASDSLPAVPAAKLVYLLVSGTGAVIDTLEEGTQYGGIRIEGASVSVDTSRISGLPAGAYAVVAYETANDRIRVEIPFRTGEPGALARPKHVPVRRTLGRKVYDLLGRVFRSQGK